MIQTSLSKKLKALVKAKRGATAVEFALVALPTIALLLGTVQLGIIYFTSQGLEEAVSVSSRYIKTGRASNDNANLNTIRREMCQYLVFSADCERDLKVSVRAFSNPSQANLRRFYRGNFPIVRDEFDLGNPNDIVFVSASLDFPIVFSFIPTSFGGESRPTRNFERLFAASVVRNEQFNEIVTNN